MRRSNASTRASSRSRGSWACPWARCFTTRGTGRRRTRARTRRAQRGKPVFFLGGGLPANRRCLAQAALRGAAGPAQVRGGRLPGGEPPRLRALGPRDGEHLRARGSAGLRGGPRGVSREARKKIEVSWSHMTNLTFVPKLSCTLVASYATCTGGSWLHSKLQFNNFSPSAYSGAAAPSPPPAASAPPPAGAGAGRANSRVSAARA